MKRLQTSKGLVTSSLNQWRTYFKRRKPWFHLRRMVITLATMGWCACGSQKPAKVEAERPSIGTTIFQLVCGRVAQKSYPNDLSGRKTRDFCYHHGLPPQDAPPRLWALYDERQRLIGTIDEVFSAVDATALQATVKKLFKGDPQQDAVAVQQVEQLLGHWMMMVRDSPGMAGWLANWHQETLTWLQQQFRGRAPETITWLDISLGRHDIASQVIATSGQLLGANRQPPPHWLQAIYRLQQQKQAFWQQPLLFWQQPEVMFEAAHVVLALAAHLPPPANAPTQSYRNIPQPAVAAPIDWDSWQATLQHLGGHDGITLLADGLNFLWEAYQPLWAKTIQLFWQGMLQRHQHQQTPQVSAVAKIRLQQALSALLTQPQALATMLEAFNDADNSRALLVALLEHRDGGPWLGQLLQQAHDVASIKQFLLAHDLLELGEPVLEAWEQAGISELALMQLRGLAPGWAAGWQAYAPMLQAWFAETEIIELLSGELPTWLPRLCNDSALGGCTILQQGLTAWFNLPPRAAWLEGEGQAIAQAMLEVLQVQRDDQNEWQFTNPHVRQLVTKLLEQAPSYVATGDDPLAHIRPFVEGPFGHALWLDWQQTAASSGLWQQWLQQVGREHRDLMAKTIFDWSMLLQNPAPIAPVLTLLDRALAAQHALQTTANPLQISPQEAEVIATLLTSLLQREPISNQRRAHVIWQSLAQVARATPRSRRPLDAFDVHHGILTALVNFTRDPVHGLPRVISILTAQHGAPATTAIP